MQSWVLIYFAGPGLPTMDWSSRMRIAMGSAKGLAYLHEDCKLLINYNINFQSLEKLKIQSIHLNITMIFSRFFLFKLSQMTFLISLSLFNFTNMSNLQAIPALFTETSKLQTFFSTSILMPRYMGFIFIMKYVANITE